jgi:GNAT superfamily N-acetyltransferase
MGSAPELVFPDADSGSLILTHPTEAERIRTWTLTHPSWGVALGKDNYVKRETFMMTVPLSKLGGMSHWILTVKDLPPDDRPLLSSCETLRKRSVVSRSDGTVVDTMCHGIGSVFTDPQFRGRRYASRMLRMLREQLREWQGRRMGETKSEDCQEQQVACSILYSDIGKKFYANLGWLPFESTHLKFPPADYSSHGGRTANGDTKTGAAEPLASHEFPLLCDLDEKLLRRRIAQHSKESGKPAFAIVPDLDQMMWYSLREDFLTKHIIGRTPTVNGAMFGEQGRRVWAIWARAYYGPLVESSGNTLYILRMVIEDESCSDDYLACAIRAIIEMAQTQAIEWHSSYVSMWNPTGHMRKLVEMAGLEHQSVIRENDSIASLMWYGHGNVDWYQNEKYGWC